MRSGRVPKKGDEFRDKIAALLRAAGFSNVEVEKGVGFKNVDLRSVWTRSTIDGPLTYLIEAKDYSVPVPLDECSLFAAQYGPLVESGAADRAWLVARGSISSKGADQIRSSRGRHLDCFTFSELQRKLFGIDSYLADIQELYRISGMERYYVRPHCADNSDLEEIIMRWIDDSTAPPVAIVGTYGQGKSTFALHLSQLLIRQATIDPTSRLPILIPLGEIVDEQSVEGLIGKVLASRHRVENYHFHLFSALNENGRFVLLFDGFDEMKHGMTPFVFESNVDELMRLDRGFAKIIILGRNTVFQTDREFKTIMLGRQYTLGGQEIPTSRRAFTQHELRNFTIPESESFVRNYFPERMNQARRDGTPLNAHWMDARMAQILSGRYNDLITRPVHAQMMCDIASDPRRSLGDFSQYELYDAFVHHLIKREVEKKGRYRKFNRDVRRRFNSGVAWWLWKQGGASTSSLPDLPIDLCRQAAGGINHDFDEEGLKRELVAGCLVEKRAGAIYFPHRSIQEFLVADFIWSNLEDSRSLGRQIDFTKFREVCTPEVTDFIVGKIAAESKHNSDTLVRAKNFIALLRELPSSGMSEDQLGPFFAVAQASGLRNPDQTIPTDWALILSFFLENAAMSFLIHSPAALRFIDDLLERVVGKADRILGTIFYLWGRVLRSNILERAIVQKFLAYALPTEDINYISKNIGKIPALQYEVKKF